MGKQRGKRDKKDWSRVNRWLVGMLVWPCLVSSLSCLLLMLHFSWLLQVRGSLFDVHACIYGESELHSWSQTTGYRGPAVCGAANRASVCLCASNWGDWTEWKQMTSTYVCIYIFSLVDVHPPQPESGAGRGHWCCVCSCERFVCLSMLPTWLAVYLPVMYTCALCSSAYWEYIFSFATGWT